MAPIVYLEAYIIACLIGYARKNVMCLNDYSGVEDKKNAQQFAGLKGGAILEICAD
jgi:hypothetical protein